MKFSITISAENRRGTTITWLEHTGQMPQRSCRNICKRCTAICSGKQVLTRCTVQTRERGNRSCPNNKNQLSHYSWRGDSVQREIPIDIVLFILFHPAIRRVYPALSSLRSIGFSLTRLKICPEFRRIVYATCEKS